MFHKACITQQTQACKLFSIFSLFAFLNIKSEAYKNIICVCVCVCVCMHVHAHVCVCARMHVHACMCMHVCTHACVHVYACMRVHAHVCVCMCMCACVCVHVRACVRVCARARVCVCALWPQFFHQVTNFHKTWHECYATGGHTIAILQSPTPINNKMMETGTCVIGVTLPQFNLVL